MEAPSRIELEMAILQTAALPLGYGAVLSCVGFMGNGARRRRKLHIIRL